MSNMNDLSSISYTNKDFNDIYSELLNYASKISYKWDPSSSDESDPGVVLLKLAAIIGDKNNYNIDKNILELMPVSVTQMPNARQIFDQCGYSMKYYRAAEGFLQINLKTKLKTKDETNQEVDDESKYSFPRFTTFTDSENNIVYTSIQESSLIGNAKGYDQISVPVIQGIPTVYSVDNNSIVTLQNLDSYNRLHIVDTDIAENGIFITNVDADNYDEWQKVDVLNIEAPLTRIYKFGVSLDGTSCYIEFPDDINQLIGEGLKITYIRTKGIYGNVGVNKINKLYVDTVLTIQDEQNSYENRQITNDELKIRNDTILSGGADPETIDDAYRSYQRVKNTFDTLVSLKDYTDYMVTSESASNGFVCDRTNDIQFVHKILQNDQFNTSFKNVIENKIQERKVIDKNENEVTFDDVCPKMTAYDLCVYALTYVHDSDLTTLVNYDKTFTLVSGDDFIDKLNKEDIKAISHDFVDFEPNKILMIKNKYPIRAQIISKYKLTAAQYNEVQSNIHTSLFIALNSKKMSFGSEANYDVIYDAILNSDARIKAVSLEYPTYETYAIYMSEDKFKELRIDSKSFGGYERVPFNDVDNTCKQYDPVNDKLIAADTPYSIHNTYYKYNEDLHELWTSFRAEIFAKNVLKGVTPLYTEDTTFSYGLTQNYRGTKTDVSHIVTNAKIDFKSGQETILRENENVVFTAPNLIKESEFSSYVKYQYYLKSTVEKDQEYELTGDDFIVFFWKADSEDDEYTYLKYDNSNDSLAKYFSSNKSLKVKDSPVKSNIEVSRINSLKNLTAGVTKKLEDSSLNSYVKEKLQGSDYVFTGQHIITTKKPNTILVNSSDNGTRYIYWITNTKDSGGNSKLTFNNNKYTLANDEYFIYTNDAKTSLYVLGQGTRIEATGTVLNTITTASCKPVSYIDLATYGPDAIQNWVVVDKATKNTSGDNNLTATEMLQYVVGPGNKVILEKNNITLNNEFQTLNNFTIKFVDENGVETILPSRGTSVPWEARTLLNLHVGPDIPQVLQSYHEVDIGLTEQQTQQSGETITIPVPLTDCTLLTDRAIDLTGTTSSGIDVTSVAGMDLYDKLNVMWYAETSSSDNDVTCDPKHFTVKVDLNKSSENDTQDITKSITTKINKGKYLLKLEGAHISNIQASVSASSGTVSLTRFDTNNYMLYKLNVNIDEDITFSFTCTISKTSNLIIHPLYKYTDSILTALTNNGEGSSQDSFENMVITKLNDLDPECEFDHTYKIQENQITNPLESNSFLYRNHFYNPFTICQWDVVSEKTNIALLTNVK